MAVTETKLNDEVKKLLGALELVQELRTCCTTSQTIPVNYYWEKIRFSKDKDSKEFMGKFELEDISDWAELHVNTERIAKCPYCGNENSIDVEEYIYDETMEEKSCGIDEMGSIGDVWTVEQVMDVYGNDTLKKTLEDRKASVGTFMDIISNVIRK